MMNEKRILEAKYNLLNAIPRSSLEDYKSAEEAIKVLVEAGCGLSDVLSPETTLPVEMLSWVDPEEFEARQYFMSHGDDIETLRRKFIDPEEIEARQYFASHGDDIETLKKLLS